MHLCILGLWAKKAKEAKEQEWEEDEKKKKKKPMKKKQNNSALHRSERTEYTEYTESCFSQRSTATLYYSTHRNVRLISLLSSPLVHLFYSLPLSLRSSLPLPILATREKLRCMQPLRPCKWAFITLFFHIRLKRSNFYYSLGRISKESVQIRSRRMTKDLIAS